MSSSPTFEKVCFSDIDGTLVHYPDHGTGQAEGTDLLLLPPSSTGLQGVISKQTILGVSELRRAGIGFALVSGARTSTVLQRLPCLPAVDAYVTENGGRIFYPHSDIPTAVPLTEDLEWRKVLEDVTGPPQQEHLPPGDRKGLLWDWYRTLNAAGWKLDAAGYSTCFRVKADSGHGPEDLRKVISSAPSGLTCTFNLGVADFYPAKSGKAGAAAYLMQRWGTLPSHTAFLCDDDNDLELAAQVGRAFLPSLTSESVKTVVRTFPQHYVAASKEGTAASEEMVEAVRQHLLAL